METMTSGTVPNATVNSETVSSTTRLPLRRPFQGRMLTGVSAGLADYLGMDVTLVRIAFVALVLFGGAGIPIYLAGLLLIPDEGSDQSILGSILSR